MTEWMFPARNPTGPSRSVPEPTRTRMRSSLRSRWCPHPTVFLYVR
jgi:hypothetical protein